MELWKYGGKDLELCYGQRRLDKDHANRPEFLLARNVM